MMSKNWIWVCIHVHTSFLNLTKHGEISHRTCVFFTEKMVWDSGSETFMDYTKRNGHFLVTKDVNFDKDMFRMVQGPASLVASEVRLGGV